MANILKFPARVKKQYREPPLAKTASAALSKADRILVMTERHPRFALDHPLDAIHAEREGVARKGVPNCRNGRCWEGRGEPVPEEPAEEVTEIESLQDEIDADRQAFREYFVAERWTERRTVKERTA